MFKVQDLRTGKISEYNTTGELLSGYPEILGDNFKKKNIIGDVIRIAETLATFGYRLSIEEDEEQMTAAQLIENMVNELSAAQDFLNETIESRDIHNEITDLISDIDCSLDQFNDIEEDIYKAIKEIKL